MRDFAQELVDLVIDEVAAAAAHPNTQDIGTCGRVCRRWLARSRMHLFSRICIRLSRTNPVPIQSFFDIVDASLSHIFSFVHSLDLQLINGEVSQDQVERLRNSGMTDLRVIPENAVLRQDRLHFQRLMQTHIRRFGACPSLTHFEFGFPSDIELHVITDLISALPFLTYLGIYGGTGSYTIVQFETAPARDAFPAHLHEMDISLNGGTGLFFEWLLSHRKPPIFTSLTLSGSARGESIAPIETYLRLHGAAIETLSLQYWVDDLPETQTFENLALAWTPRLVNLSLAGQYPTTIPTLMQLSSIHLISLEISVCSMLQFGPANWYHIDEILAARFRSLERVLFTDAWLETSLTPEISALMPQARARNNLVNK